MFRPGDWGLSSDRMPSHIGSGRLFAPRAFSAQSRQRFYRDRRRRWTAHLGGELSDAQAVLVEQACALEWDIRKIEVRGERAGRLTQHDRNALAAWRRHFRELVRQLGPPAKAKPPSLAEVLATPGPYARAARAAAEEAERRRLEKQAAGEAAA